VEVWTTNPPRCILHRTRRKKSQVKGQKVSGSKGHLEGGANSFLTGKGKFDGKEGTPRKPSPPARDVKQSFTQGNKKKREVGHLVEGNVYYPETGGKPSGGSMGKWRGGRKRCNNEHDSPRWTERGKKRFCGLYHFEADLRVRGRPTHNSG